MSERWKFETNEVTVSLWQNAKKQLILNVKIGPLKEKICITEPEVMLKFKQFILSLDS